MAMSVINRSVRRTITTARRSYGVSMIPAPAKRLQTLTYLFIYLLIYLLTYLLTYYNITLHSKGSILYKFSRR